MAKGTSRPTSELDLDPPAGATSLDGRAADGAPVEETPPASPTRFAPLAASPAKVASATSGAATALTPSLGEMPAPKRGAREPAARRPGRPFPEPFRSAPEASSRVASIGIAYSVPAGLVGSTVTPGSRADAPGALTPKTATAQVSSTSSLPLRNRVL